MLTFTESLLNQWFSDLIFTKFKINNVIFTKFLVRK